MAILTRQGGVWKDSAPRVKDAGVWKEVEKGYVRDEGVWKEFYTGGPEIGAPFEGGFYFGNIHVGGEEYLLIVADKSAESVLAWRSVGQSGGYSYAWSTDDSKYNTDIMVDSVMEHPAAEYCRSYTGGGYTDWNMPALLEFPVLNTNLSPYEASTPDIFKAGGPQALFGSYWTSTEWDVLTGIAFVQTFETDGTLSESAASFGPTVTFTVRPTRRVKI